MLHRLFNQHPLDQLTPTRSALSYSQFDLAILSLCAQAIAYYVRTGHWPLLAAHDACGTLVWPS